MIASALAYWPIALGALWTPAVLLVTAGVIREIVRDHRRARRGPLAPVYSLETLRADEARAARVRRRAERRRAAERGACRALYGPHSSSVIPAPRACPVPEFDQEA